MTQKSKSRNADIISIAAERQSTTLGPKGRCLLSECEHNLPPTGGHNPRGEAPSTLAPQVPQRAPQNH